MICIALQPIHAEQIRESEGSFTLTFDEAKWKLVQRLPQEKGESLVFCLGKNCAFANLVSSDPTDTLETLKIAFLEKIKQTVMEPTLLFEEVREVHGAPMLYLRLSGKTIGPTIDFDAYLCVTPKCSLTFLVTTLNKDREKYETEIFSFLNGIETETLVASQQESDQGTNS